MNRLRGLDQVYVVGILVLLVAVVFAVSLPGFATSGNIADALDAIVPLGIFGIAMMLVIVGGGLDLSLAVTAMLSVAATLQALSNGSGLFAALMLGLLIAIGVGLLNGLLIAYGEVPPIFATIGTGLLFYGIARLTVIRPENLDVPQAGQSFFEFATKRVAGVPVGVAFVLVLAIVVHLILKRTVPGRFLYAKGDNGPAARLTGLPVRPLTVVTFVAAAVLAMIAGLMITGQGRGLTSSLGFSSLVYDVIAVAVIGGVSLAGGRGKVAGVVLGAVLVGLLMNGMTLMNLNVDQQTFLKSSVLLIALLIDAVLHPRSLDEIKVGDL